MSCGERVRASGCAGHKVCSKNSCRRCWPFPPFQIRTFECQLHYSTEPKYSKYLPRGLSFCNFLRASSRNLIECLPGEFNGTIFSIEIFIKYKISIEKVKGVCAFGALSNYNI